MEDDYTPTIEDLKDFEEFNQQLCNARKDEVKQWVVTHNGITKPLTRETICTIVSHLLANTIPQDCVESFSLTERLAFVSLLGYDIDVLFKVICKDLSEDEIIMLRQGARYPYLLTFLTAVVGDSNLEHIRQVTKTLKGTHILPYIQFYDNDWGMSNRETLRTKYELISLWTPEHRPMYSYGTIALLESGCCDSEVMSRTSEKPVEVDCKTFLIKLFNCTKHLLPDIRAQFGIVASQIPTKNAMRFTSSISLLPFVELYFNVKLLDKPNKRYKHGMYKIEIPNWYEK